MGFKGDEYLWHDRRRRLGLPLSFTRYALSEDRLFLSIGFFNLKDEDILLYRVRDLSLQRTLWQRIFGVGTITVSSSDKTMPTLVIKNVKKPAYVKELIHDQVENAKIARRVRIGEIMASNYEEGDEDTEDDELDQFPG
jgi:uncharacterized membrane protein YdbT with pleckstrin-like domain